jgi:hypothetical protein
MTDGPTYALLPRASANRVYGAVVPALLQAELALLDAALPAPRLVETTDAAIGGVDYVLATTNGPGWSTDDLAVLSNLSTLHALFRCEGDLLRPEPLDPVRCQDEDVVTIQRYAGKTNEAFTHLLVNLALAASAGGFRRLVSGDRLRLLDPACGRGTSLNRAVVYGMDAVGVELDRRDVEAYEAFIVGWCKDKRLKHQVDRARLRKGRTTPATTFRLTYGTDKDRTGHRQIDVIADDTLHTAGHLSARSVDLLVCDLPYGVQHGARPAEGQLERDPAELLVAALPEWRQVLRSGAGVALAWNRRTLDRPRLVAVVEAAGFEVLGAAKDDRFLHRVDRSITRDVLIARRAPG